MASIKIASGLLLAASLGVIVHAQVAPAPEVRCEGSSLTVRAVGAPLKAVMDLIVERCNVEVLGQDQIDGNVTITIEARPFNEAIDALLGGYNYLVGARPAKEPESSARWQVRIVSKIGADARLHKADIAGPVHLPAIEAALQADKDMADPVDPEEQQEREANLANLTKAGAFLPQKPVASLLELYEEEDNPLVRRRALFELDSRAPDKALPVLLEALADEDLNEDAIEMLGRRKDAASLIRVGEYLAKEVDLTGKIGAFRVLALRADPSSLQYVRQVARDENQIIREAAAQFITEMEQRRKAKEGR